NKVAVSEGAAGSPPFYGESFPAMETFKSAGTCTCDRIFNLVHHVRVNETNIPKLLTRCSVLRVQTLKIRRMFHSHIRVEPKYSSGFASMKRIAP
ncbi:hypothetical protein, partial [Paenibacillus polymyxa]|uniref:hypothetical protein n=1 Tax=Paenibacillus polymyxa TaxID=1406 RepID=UPI001C8433C0